MTFIQSWTQRQAGLSERLLSQGRGENIPHPTVVSCSLTRKVRPGLKMSYTQKKKKKKVLPIRYFMLPAKQALMTDSTFRVGSNPSFPQEFEVSRLFIISMSLCVFFLLETYLISYSVTFSLYKLEYVLFISIFHDP